jgi:hypothetical protein
LYRYEIWYLTLREEHKLKVFENRALRRIIEPMREEVAGDRRRLHKEELHNWYASINIIRVTKSRRISWRDMWHGRDEKCIKYFGCKT